MAELETTVLVSEIEAIERAARRAHAAYRGAIARTEAAEATLERVRAAIALCYPDDMTPAAKRVLDAALAPVTEEGENGEHEK